MTRNRKILLGLATAAALAASAAAGAAAGEGPGMMGSGPGGGSGMMGSGMMGSGPGGGAGMMGSGPGGGQGMMGAAAEHGRGAGAGFSPAAMVEGRLAALKTELKITANQESAWQAFATKAKQQVESMHAQRTQASAATQTAPERLAQRAEFAKQRAANVEAMSAAVKDLYDVLTPEQKAIADQRLAFAGMGPMMAMRGFRH